MAIPDTEERSNWPEDVFEEITAENFQMKI